MPCNDSSTPWVAYQGEQPTIDDLPSSGHVPTESYTRLLDQRGKDRERIKELEGMLLDAWLACQAGRPVGDVLVIRVLHKRAESWRHALGVALPGFLASSQEENDA